MSLARSGQTEAVDSPLAKVPGGLHLETQEKNPFPHHLVGGLWLYSPETTGGTGE